LDNIVDKCGKQKYQPVVEQKDPDVLLFQADSLEFMEYLIDYYPDGVFDMIFADPPYFLSNGGITCQSGQMVSVNKGDWDASRGVLDNHHFNLTWLRYCQQLLKPNGTIWVSGTQHIIHSIGFAMQTLEYKLLNDITWEKPAPPPNLSCRYFTHATETIIWAAKNEKTKHFFDYKLMKQINKNRQMKSIWQIGAPSDSEKKFGKHPTQKPIGLLNRIILASTKPGDLIFDPFSGSSTTGVSAIRLGRKFIGCEIDEIFAKLSKKRLENAIETLTTGLFDGLDN